MMGRLLERVMDRYRGRRSLLGRLVFRADVRWVKRQIQYADQSQTPVS